MICRCLWNVNQSYKNSKIVAKIIQQKSRASKKNKTVWLLSDNSMRLLCSRHSSVLSPFSFHPALSIVELNGDDLFLVSASHGKKPNTGNVCPEPSHSFSLPFCWDGGYNYVLQMSSSFDLFFPHSNQRIQLPKLKIDPLRVPRQSPEPVLLLHKGHGHRTCAVECAHCFEPSRSHVV